MNTTQSNLTLAIIGFGGIGNWHRELIDTIDGIDVRGIYDICESRKTFAKECNLISYTTLTDLLEDTAIDIVLVSTPNDLHKPIAIEAMKAGKHVVCEKPVTLSSSDLEEMIQVSKETNRFLTVHQNRRWDEDFLTVKHILQKEMLGEIFRIESRVHGSIGIPGDWRQEKEKGGGMILDWGVHLLDQILLLMPSEKLTHVYASVTNVTNQLVDDGFTTELTFSNGIQVLVEVGTSNFISLPRWYVLGQNGTAIIENWELDGKVVTAQGANPHDVVPVRTAAGLTKTMAPRREDTKKISELPIVKSDIRDFYKNVMDVIQNNAEPKIKLSEVMRVMKLMEAIFESAEKRCVIPFE